MEKSYLIEGYRFIVAISIIMFHFLKLWSNTNNLRLGVEFFFILSGFLLMAHIEKHPEESVPHLMLGKLRSLYPGMFIVFWLAAAAAALLEKDQSLPVIAYQHLSQLMFLTNAFHGRASWLIGTNQLWFLVSMFWGTLILAWIIRTYRRSYESALAVLIPLCCYTVCIRCGDNLITIRYWTIGEYEIYMPLLLMRALAGLCCGTLACMAFKRLNIYTFTRFATVSGTVISVLCFFAALGLSTQSSEAAINSYSWRSLIVVVLYAVSITFSFVFTQDLPGSVFARRLLAAAGRLSMPIYMTHSLAYYIISKTIDVSGSNIKCLVFVLAGTAVLSLIYMICDHLLRKGCTAFAGWLKSVCIAVNG